MLGPTIRRKASRFGKLVRSSAMTPRTGVTRKPVLARRDELGITFIGHASFFLQMGGKNILVDPNFARWIFVLKRLRRPGLPLRAIARLARWQSGKRPVIVVPRHVRDLVSDLGYGRTVELDWWGELQLGQVQVTHVPARHWGARIVRDMYRGYGGYVLRAGAHSVYHAGDTAYFEGFQEIGQRLHPQVALLPIGAYQPDSFRAVHASPEDALQAFLDLGARWMVPMHYGTFRLSHEPVEEPVQRLKLEAKRLRIERKICVLEEGVTKFFE